MKKIALTLIAAFGMTSASAGIINFDTCRKGCVAIDASRGDVVETLATLEFSDNASGGVDFTLTNSFGNRFPGDDDWFTSRVFLNLSATPASISNASSNIDFFDFDDDNLAFSGLLFDTEFNFADTFASGLRITNGQTASWTFDAFSSVDIELPSLVELQQRSINGNNRTTLTGSFGSQDVPEPSGFALGLLMAGVLISRRRRTAAI